MRPRIAVVLAVLALASTGAFAAAPKIETDEQKTMYALGLSLARDLEHYTLSAEELEILQAGLSDGVLKQQPKVDLEQYRQKVQALASARLAKRAEAEKTAEKKASEEFLKRMEAEKGAVRTDSGLIYIELSPGSGDSPKASQTVKVHYHGTLRDGVVFDSTVQRNRPGTFPLNRVIPCWREGLQRMKVGGKAKLICPSNLAYGDRGAPPKIKPGAVLAFEVELLEIVSTPRPARPTPGSSPLEKKQ